MHPIPLVENQLLPRALEIERVLSRSQTAQLLNVSVPTLDRLRRAGRLPRPVQVSDRRVGWRTRDLLEHVASHVEEGVA
jgi:predicted DNA-binding transcriptional regulator AlpA